MKDFKSCSRLLIFSMYLFLQLRNSLAEIRPALFVSSSQILVTQTQSQDSLTTGEEDNHSLRVSDQPMLYKHLTFALSFVQANFTSKPDLTPSKLYFAFSDKSKDTEEYMHLQEIINDPDFLLQSVNFELHLTQNISCNGVDVNPFDEADENQNDDDNNDDHNNKMNHFFNGKIDNERNIKSSEIITSYLMNHAAWVQVQHHLQNKDDVLQRVNNCSSSVSPDLESCNNDSRSISTEYESDESVNHIIKNSGNQTVDDSVDYDGDNSYIPGESLPELFPQSGEDKGVQLAHRCYKVSKSNDKMIAEGRDWETDHEALVIDVLPLFQHWFSGSSDKCPKQERNLETFIFNLMIDGTLMSLDLDQDLVELMIGCKPIIQFRYAMDRRCSIPMTEGCKESNEEVGECEICRMRSYCQLRTCGVSCDFEGPCAWEWKSPGNGETGFRNMSAAQVVSRIQKLGEWAFRGPLKDPANKTDGHFLLLAWENGTKQQTHYRLTSPMFSDSQQSCNLQANVHMHNMEKVALRMVIRTQNHSSYVPMSVLGNGKNVWEPLKQMVGKMSQPFQIILEVDNHAGIPSHFAIDDIRLVDCIPSTSSCKATCSQKEFQCGDGTCIERSKICDLHKDCLFGEDEDQVYCGQMPPNTACNFEESWCGWSPQNQFNITWERTNKPYFTDKSGPQFDHTYGNSSGYLLLVNMKVKKSSFHQAVIRSPVFAHPPGYNQNRSSPYFESCQLRFFYHMYGAHVQSLDVELVLINSRNPWVKPLRFCERSGNQGNMWHRAACKLPSIKGSKKYYIQITATKGIRGHAGDIAIDDISLSPECFGLGVPTSETVGYDYNRILNTSDDNHENLTVSYRFTSCNNTGRNGPTAEQCDAVYNGTLLSSSITMDHVREGVQIWTVPESNSYTLIAKGASGGRGALVNQMTSHGSIVKVTMYFRKGEQIYILIGQEGVSVCDQTGVESVEKDQICKNNSDKYSALALVNKVLRKSVRQATQAPTSKPRPLDDIIQKLNSINKLNGGGGGGGGATFVFRMNGNNPVPILIAAGGGGLGYNASSTIYPNGRGLNVSLQPHSGSTQQWGAGGGGGWEGQIIKNNNTAEKDINFSSRFRTTPEFQNDSTMLVAAGLSLIDGGGLGGKPCSSSDLWGAAGGFGGGGGACTSGGGGGGYVGGNAHVSLSANGEGGWSYIGKGGMYPAVEPGGHGGPGELIAIPSFAGCGCEHACVLLDDFEPHSGCVCPENWILSEDGITCAGRDPIPRAYLIALIVFILLIFCVCGILCFCLYNRYQRQKVSMMNRKNPMNGTELQLSRLRAQSGPNGVLTEYNPNYEFGGETYNLTDLKEIPRENLRLVKALGQGAFGEVYQGFYRHRDGDAVEMPVAVKTLPELSSNQAEMDFLMEALIMSKFNHPNIVHFIGVCFDKHPRFIILELLAGGDLKTFLRESRPKPDKGSPLSMKDLLLCAIDVAKGCKYLEDNHFIHRDIAARNCLLTTKGPGRVVKIADFGMARDIYRADYYKKGGKAMLPVKWMPPEAFLDGIFTSKTDIWSYGVLLWEIFSLGYMPYPGRGNQDVMQLVTNGGRLEPPSNCPTPVYGIMTQCWHPIPEERPNFATVMERLGYCIQDPEVVNAPLPIFQRPPSSERDTTLMRPLNTDDSSCLRIIHGYNQRSNNPSPLSYKEPLSPNSCTGDYLVPLTPLSNPTTPPPPPDSAVTSPTSPEIPESQSTETILEDETAEDEEKGPEGARAPTPPAKTPATNSSTSSDSKQKKPNTNGIDSGITLTPASLESVDKSRRPIPYANVGSKKSDNRPDEEIRC